MTSCLHVAAPCVLQSLDAALKKALRSDLEDVSRALLMTPAHFDAYLLRKATKVDISGSSARCQRRVFVSLSCSWLHCFVLAVLSDLSSAWLKKFFGIFYCLGLVLLGLFCLALLELSEL